MTNLRALLVCIVLAFAGATAAQDSDFDDTLMSERAYRELSAIHERMNDGDLERALNGLEALQSEQVLNAYEQALVLQTYGYVFLRRGEPARAIKHFEACLALDALPRFARQGMLYSLATLYASEARWPDALRVLEAWMETGPEADPETLAMIAGIYVQAGRHADARPYIEAAIDVADEAQPAWYELLAGIGLNTGEPALAARAARALIAASPERRSHWELLQAALLEQGDDAAALASLELGWLRGVQGRPQDVLRLARMQLYMGVPRRAVLLLRKAFDDETLAQSEAHLELLFSACRAARDHACALLVLDELTKRDAGGEALLRKARLLSERHRWQEVAAAAAAAIERGALGRDQLGDAWLLKGIAAAELGDLAGARQSFDAAVATGGQRAGQARSWLIYLDDQAD